MLGIFDSGIGGLSVAAAIREKAPDVDIVYFGDTANAPYAKKSQQELEKLTLKAFRLLRSEGATQLVSACNSVSASVVLPMLELFGVHDSGIIEMVHPAAQFLKNRINGRTIVIATPATVNSQMYQKGFQEVGVNVRMIACPDLSGIIELGGLKEELDTQVGAIAEQVLASDCNTLILGCTHYSFVKDKFEKYFAEEGRTIFVFDPAEAVAASALTRHGIFGSGKTKFIVSKNSLVFHDYAKRLFGGTIVIIEQSLA